MFASIRLLVVMNEKIVKQYNGHTSNAIAINKPQTPERKPIMLSNETFGLCSKPMTYRM